MGFDPRQSGLFKGKGSYVQFAPSHPKYREVPPARGGISTGYLGSKTAALEEGDLRRLESATDLRLPQDKYTATFSYLLSEV